MMGRSKFRTWVERSIVGAILLACAVVGLWFGGTPAPPQTQIPPLPSVQPSPTSFTSKQADGLAQLLLNALLRYGPDEAKAQQATFERVTGCRLAYANVGLIDGQRRVFKRDAFVVGHNLHLIPGQATAPDPNVPSLGTVGLTIGVSCPPS